MAFICITAYGVASRTMIKQNEVEFSIQSILGNIFYAPYWFLYADAEGEKQTLDGLLFHIIHIIYLPFVSRYHC